MNKNKTNIKIQKCSTSETTRKDTFTQNNNQWLAGFLEGDGHFNLERCTIIINQKDKAVFRQIRRKFKCGKITGPYYNYKKVNKKWVLDKDGNRIVSSIYHRMVISKQTQVTKIINCLNGHILLNETYDKFQLFVERYNEKYHYLPSIKCLPKPPLEKQINLESAWLAGFVDAEGCFNITNNGASFRFIVDQSDEEVALNQITNLFNGSVTLKNKSKSNLNSKKKHFRYTAGHRNDVRRVIDYVDTYKLHSAKWRDYLKWKKAFKRRWPNLFD